MESKQNRTMEKLGKSNGRREGMEGKKQRGRIGVSGRGVRWGEGWRDKRVAWAGSLGRGQAMWSEALLGSCWEAKEPAG